MVTAERDASRVPRDVMESWWGRVGKIGQNSENWANYHLNRTSNDLCVTSNKLSVTRYTTSSNSPCVTRYVRTFFGSTVSLEISKTAVVVFKQASRQRRPGTNWFFFQDTTKSIFACEIVPRHFSWSESALLSSGTLRPFQSLDMIFLSHRKRPCIRIEVLVRWTNHSENHLYSH